MLICDKRRPRTRGDTNIRPPQGGRIKTAPPASGPRLGRSLAGGLHPQTPRAAPPGAPSRTGPLLPRSSSRRGSGHGCDGGGGGQPLAVVHARRLAPGGFRASGEISKAGPCRGTEGGFGGRAPRVGRRWATRPRRWAARVQPLAAVPAVHGLGEVVHGRPGHRAQRLRHPVPARRRRSALCRFIRENDSCEFGKNPALARARARLLVFFS